jgi:hypothetical protein
MTYQMLEMYSGITLLIFCIAAPVLIYKIIKRDWHIKELRARNYVFIFGIICEYFYLLAYLSP